MPAVADRARLFAMTKTTLSPIQLISATLAEMRLKRKLVEKIN